MTKIVQAIYDMLGNSSSSRPPDTAEERAKSIFARMDENGDGKLTEEEFLKGCLQDEELSKMLSPGFKRIPNILVPIETSLGLVSQLENASEQKGGGDLDNFIIIY